MQTISLILYEAGTPGFQTVKHNDLSELQARSSGRQYDTAGRDGCPSHSLWWLLSGVHSLRQGKVSPNALPLIYDHAPAMVRADAQGILSLLAVDRSPAMLVDKSRHHGLVDKARRHGSSITVFIFCFVMAIYCQRRCYA